MLPIAAVSVFEPVVEQRLEPAILAVGVEQRFALMEPEPSELVEHEHTATPQCDDGVAGAIPSGLRHSWWRRSAVVRMIWM